MSLESPFAVLFNAQGTELAVTASQSGSFMSGTQPGVLIMGSSSVGAQFFRVNADGTLVVSSSAQQTVNQGLSGSIPQSWYVSITDGAKLLGSSSAAPFFVAVSGATFDLNGNLVVKISGANVLNGALVVTGTVATTTIKCPNTTVTSWGASLTSATILPANGLRCGGTFFLEGNALAYLKLGTGANATGSYTVQLMNNGFFELPKNYTGAVSAVFNKDDSTKILRITEIFE